MPFGYAIYRASDISRGRGPAKSREIPKIPRNPPEIFKIMLITYKVLHDRAPIYIQELLQLYTPSCNLRSSNRNVLVKPYFNLNSYGKRAFSVAAPELWNNLPEDIKSANSIDDFKRKLKTFLFMRAYES